MEEDQNKPDNGRMKAKPGSLRSTVTMEIQTALAQRFVSGRERAPGIEPIIGLEGFGQRTRMLWHAAANDDPYADWFLLRIEESIESTKKMMDGHNSRIGALLEAMDGFRVEIAHSVHPIEVPLRFSNPIAYMAAYLIADFDKLSRALLTARHLALIERRRSDEILNRAGKSIRRTLNLATQWRYTGVTREDLRQMNQNADRARKMMGDVPDGVTSGRKRARISPPINPIPDRSPVPPDADSDGGETRKAAG